MCIERGLFDFAYSAGQRYLGAVLKMLYDEEVNHNTLLLTRRSSESFVPKGVNKRRPGRVPLQTPIDILHFIVSVLRLTGV
eukprot:6933517-Pyramimonas_sp.AAC.1